MNNFNSLKAFLVQKEVFLVPTPYQQENDQPLLGDVGGHIFDTFRICPSRFEPVTAAPVLP